MKVWRTDGLLAWTNLAPERIGRRFPPGHHLQEVLESGEAEFEFEFEFESLHDAEDAEESRLGVEHVLEVYAPIRSAAGPVVGAFEIYADSAPLEAAIAERRR